MEMNERLSELLQEAGAVSFGAIGIHSVEETEWERFEQWLRHGMHAGMAYMENYPEIRKDPRLLLPGARSIISVAFNYRQPNPYRGLATYALGEDYHKVLRDRLKKVANEMRKEYGGNWRVCIDSAPVLERYWALECGVGFRSPAHGNIVVPGVGSMVFLAEIITTLAIEMPGKYKDLEPCEMSGGRGACPTGALQEGGTVDSRRCINYLTIEKKEPLTAEEKRMVGDVIFGCDLCQRGCVENQMESVSVVPEFHPMPGLDDFMAGRVENFDIKKSPLSRSLYLRNIKKC